VTGHARRRAATGLAGHPTIESPEARLEHIRRRATAPGRRSNGGIIQNDLIGEIGEGAPAVTALPDTALIQFPPQCGSSLRVSL
jgi:hypothetical protein